jgi:low temperature requirement protein LtrA
MSRRRVFEIPSLHFEEERDEHRKVTWLELFFDLFFVVTIAQLTHALSAHPTWIDFFKFVVLFIPVWWVWIGFTYYNERFESGGLENRLFTFGLMIPVIGLAVFGHHGLDVTFRGFVLSYVCARVVITLMWFRATLFVNEFRKAGFRFVIGFSLSIVLATAAAFSGEGLKYILFGLALAIDVLTPFSTLRMHHDLPRFSSSKLPERFGLFIIIVLGEMVVGIVNGLAELEHFTNPLVIESILGVALGLGMWWIYFDFIGRRPPKEGPGWAFAWGYLHMPLVITIAATGAGVANVIGHAGELSPAVCQIISAAVGGSLITMALLEITLKKEDDEPTDEYLSPALKAGGGLIAVIIGFSGTIVDPILLMAILLVILMVQMVYGAVVWFTQEIS